MTDTGRPTTARAVALPLDRRIDQMLVRKMRRRAESTGPYRSQGLDDLARRLDGFVRRRVGDAFSLRDLRPLAGGSSKEQVAFTLVTPLEYGGEECRRLVLRLQPDESFVETDRLREFQVIRSLAGVVPVPEAWAVDPDGSELGQPGLVSAFVPGVTSPPREGAYRSQQGFGERYRTLLAPQFLAHAATLAAHRWKAGQLPAFDPVAAGTNEAVLRSIHWWKRVWEEDTLARNPLITLASHWLLDNAPVVDTVSIVHGDLRGGNFLFDPDTGVINAILDWELAHLGDRHEDLAFLLNPLFLEAEPDGREYVGGLFERDVFLAEYERLSGLPVDPVRLDYYAVFTNWRSAVMATGTAPRCVVGRKTPQDIRVAWTANSSAVALHMLSRTLEEVL